MSKLLTISFLPFLLVLFATLSPCLCLNILGLFPHPGKSHFDVFEPLLKALAEKGHNLTVIGHFPLKTPLARYKDISLRGDTDILVDIIDVDALPKGRFIYYFSPLLLITLARESCKSLRSAKMQEFLRTEEKFDLIITETFNTDCFLGFAHKFQVPFIGLSSCTVMPWSNTRFANPRNPAYIPVNLLPFSDRMNFMERVENTLYYLYSEVLFNYAMEREGYEEAKLYFGQDLPPLQKIAENISLMLVNTHFSLNLPRPLVPGIIEIGGMFLGNVKKLPQNLENYIQNAKNGVIYFSMGSMIKAHTFPEEKREAFLRAFAKLNQRVLWKWENETLPNKPDNVMIQKWMPQFDILCHPNVVAFISHGGLLGTTEAVHCGVPLIVMPQYGDQFTNAKAIEANKAGVILNFADVTEDSVLNALNAVLQPSIQNRAKELSAIYRDRPMSPLDTAVYWVEYVARHKGAPHMRTAAVDMPFYQYLLLDVIVFLLIVLSTIFICIYYLLKFIKNALCGNNTKQKVL